MSHESWHIGYGQVIELDRPRIMAILNVTPDSFSDGGQLDSVEAVVGAAERAVASGADLLDIGGESTRPGALRVSEAEQIARVVPAIDAIRRSGVVVPISVDTTHASVALAALRAGGEIGASIINDVSGGREDPDLVPLAAEFGFGLVLMDRLCPPESDSYSDEYAAEPEYGDVVSEVRASLEAFTRDAMNAGVERNAILVDPGLGFGKSVAQNLALVRGSGAFVGIGAGVLSGASRKSFVGRVSLGRDSETRERIWGSAAFSVCHYWYGARVFRVHDVAEQVQALRSVAAIRGEVGPDRWA